jgi:hypothetical protein
MKRRYLMVDVSKMKDKLESLKGKELFVRSYANGEVCIIVPLAGGFKQEIVEIGKYYFTVKFLEPGLLKDSPLALSPLKHKISAVAEIDPDLLK